MENQKYKIIYEDEIQELKQIISEYDSLVGCWLDGCDPDEILDNAWKRADLLRDIANEILDQLKNSIEYHTR